MTLFTLRPSSFPELDFKSTLIAGFDPSNELLYQIAVTFLTEPESKSDDSCPWSDEIKDELQYEVAAQFSDEEQEDKMDTSEPPASLLQSPKHRCTARTPRQKNSCRPL